MRHFSMGAVFAIAATLATAILAPTVQAGDAPLRAMLEQLRCTPRHVLALDRHDHGVVYRVDCLRPASEPAFIFCQIGRCDVLGRSRGDQE